MHGAVAIGLAAAVAATTVGASGAANAVPRHVGLTEVSAVAMSSVGGTISRMTIDSAVQRGALIDYQNHSVEIYDLAPSPWSRLASIPLAVPFGSIAINSRNHRLYVMNGGATESIAVIDIDPASVHANQAIDILPAGGRGMTAIDVDTELDKVYVANHDSNDVSVIDAATHATRSVATGRQPNDVVVDSSAHKAYVSSAMDSNITTVLAAGFSTASLANPPSDLTLGGGVLLTTTDRPLSPHLESFDPVTMTKLAASPPVGSLPTSVAIDKDLHLVYTSRAAGGLPGISTFRLETLAAEDVAPENYFRGVTVDHATHVVYASETYRNGRSPNVIAYEPHPSPLSAVDRIGGDDRFAVSAHVSADGVASGVPVVYVASGAVFADALSGSAAAGVQGGPVLLVTKDSIPADVAGELARLRPQRIVVLGGTASVSDGVKASLAGYSRSVVRIAGADRYEVSAAVSAAAFSGGANVAYIASGAMFPDALSGSAAAGREGGPVLLVQKDTVPAAVSAELARLKPSHVVVLGGVNTIDETVVATLAKDRPVDRIDGADRYAVSATISARSFSRGSYTVYVASGAVFPDALSGSAAAIANGGPVLLLTGDGVPAPVADELERLNPYRIVVLGGTNTVSDTVLTQLRAYLSA